MHIVEQLREQLAAAQSVVSNCRYGLSSSYREDAFLTPEQAEDCLIVAELQAQDIKLQIAAAIAEATKPKE